MDFFPPDQNVVSLYFVSLVPSYQLFPALAADPGETGQSDAVPITRTGSGSPHVIARQKPGDGLKHGGEGGQLLQYLDLGLFI